MLPLQQPASASQQHDLVFESHEWAALGQPLRQLRIGRKWSLRRLAAESGISVAAIQRIETGAAHGRLATVLALTEAMGEPIERVVDLVQMRKQQRNWVHVAVPRRPNLEVDLTADLREPQLRSSVVVVPAGSRLLYTPQPVGGPSCLYVLAGRAEIVFADGSSELVAGGDAVHLMASEPMTWLGRGAADTQILCVTDSRGRRLCGRNGDNA